MLNSNNISAHFLFESYQICRCSNDTRSHFPVDNENISDSSFKYSNSYDKNGQCLLESTNTIRKIGCDIDFGLSCIKTHDNICGFGIESENKYTKHITGKTSKKSTSPSNLLSLAKNSIWHLIDSVTVELYANCKISDTILFAQINCSSEYRYPVLWGYHLMNISTNQTILSIRIPPGDIWQIYIISQYINSILSYSSEVLNSNMTCLILDKFSDNFLTLVKDLKFIGFMERDISWVDANYILLSYFHKDLRPNGVRLSDKSNKDYRVYSTMKTSPTPREHGSSSHPYRSLYLSHDDTMVV